MTTDLSQAIEQAWEARDTLNAATRGPARDAVEAALSGLDDGKFRVAEKIDGDMAGPSMAEKGRAAVFPS